jgi:hypothetical protein
VRVKDLKNLSAGTRRLLTDYESGAIAAKPFINWGLAKAYSDDSTPVPARYTKGTDTLDDTFALLLFVDEAISMLPEAEQSAYTQVTSSPG